MKIIFLILPLMIVACSSVPKSTQAQKGSEEFTRSVMASSVESWDKSDCKTKPQSYEKMGWKDLLEESNSCVSAKKWPQVELIATELARRNVTSPWGPYYHSLSAEAQQQYDRALWMIEVSLKRAPQMGLLMYQKGRLLWLKQMHTEAVMLLTQALQQEPNLIEAHLFLGQIHFRDQDYSKAARHFQAVLKVRPKDPVALMGLAECFVQSGDLKGATDLYDKGNRYFAADPMFLLRKAYVLETHLNDVSQAIAIYTAVMRGYEDGKYNRKIDISLTQKIRDLEMSIKNGRAIAGSESNSGVKK